MEWFYPQDDTRGIRAMTKYYIKYGLYDYDTNTTTHKTYSAVCMSRQIAEEFAEEKAEELAKTHDCVWYTVEVQNDNQRN